MSSISYFLEEFDLTGDDGEDAALNLPDLANDGHPGLIGLVEFDDDISDPIIENGKVRMPRGGSGGGWVPRPVEFGSGVISPISGVLQGMSFATGIGEIFAKNGEVYFPLAEYNGYYGTNVAGALVGVQYATGIDKPRINNGMMEFPETGGAEVQAAEFVGTITTSVEPGGLKGAEFASGIKEPKAQNGLMQIPLADSDYFGTAVAGGVVGASYASGIDSPRVYFGEVQFPMPGDSALQGLVDDKGYFHTWEQVEGYAGSQVPVAGLQLRLAENFYATFMLNVGIQNKHLSFNFSYE